MLRHSRSTFLFETALVLSLLTAATATAQGIVVASDNFNRADESPYAIGGNWGRVIAGGRVPVRVEIEDGAFSRV
jgi:hypothetical protein